MATMAPPRLQKNVMAKPSASPSRNQPLWLNPRRHRKNDVSLKNPFYFSFAFPSLTSKAVLLWGRVAMWMIKV